MIKSCRQAPYLAPRVSLIAALSLLTPAPATAFTFSSGEIEGSLDTTISYGTRWRVQDRDERIIGIANGDTASSRRACRCARVMKSPCRSPATPCCSPG